MLATVAALSVLATGPLPAPTSSPALQSAVDTVRNESLAKFNLQPDQLGIAVASLDRGRGSVALGAANGDATFYSASVVKLHFIAYAAKLLSDGKIRFTEEFDRAARDMIVESNNDATSLIVDTITGTTSGPELSGRALRSYAEKRNVVNRWLASLGLPNENACQKTYNEGPYGRESQFRDGGKNSNRLTATGTARLMAAIALRSPELGIDAKWADWMDKYLRRPVPADQSEAAGQVRKFIGEAMPNGTILHSKAGWTSTTRHDVAWVKLPDGREYVFSIFTKNASNNQEILPSVARDLLAKLTP